MRSDTVCELVQNSQETQQSHTVYNCATLQKANIIFSCIASHMNFSSIARVSSFSTCQTLTFYRQLAVITRAQNERLETLEMETENGNVQIIIYFFLEYNPRLVATS